MFIFTEPLGFPHAVQRENFGNTAAERWFDRENGVNSAGADPMTALDLTLFGGFEGRLAGDRILDLPGQKDRALLAVLASSPGVSHSREKLANLLWSDRGDQQARDSLKHALSRL